MSALKYFLPFLLAAYSCGAQQQTESTKLPEGERQPSFLPDSSYVVTDLFADFNLPDSLVAKPIPSALKSAMERQYNDRFKGLGKADSAAARGLLRDGSQVVQRMELENGTAIYALHYADALNTEGWYFWLYKEGLPVSSKPVVLEGHLSANSVDPSYEVLLPPTPGLRTEDITGDGIPEILISMRRHNGNVYDAIVTYCFVTAASDWRELIRYEAWAKPPFVIYSRRIQRVLMPLKDRKGFFSLTTRLVGGKANPESIGETIFSSEGQPLERKPEKGTPYQELLITCHPEGEAYFFRFPPKQ